MLSTRHAVSPDVSDRTAVIKQVFTEAERWNGKTPVLERDTFDAAVTRLQGAGFNRCAVTALEVACQLG